MDSLWKITLLGNFSISRLNEKITRLQTRKIASLVGYLACFHKRPHLREELIELLWPGDDEKASRLRLNQAVWSLRRQFEPPGTSRGSFIISDRNVIQLNERSVWTDVDEFEESMRLAHKSTDPNKKAEYLKKACDLYKGEFMPSYHDAWILVERQRLALLYLEAIQATASLCEKKQDIKAAIHYARLAVREEPLNEEAHIRLIRLYLESNQPVEAVRQYDLLAEILDEQLGIGPSPRAASLRSEALSQVNTRRTQPNSKATKKASSKQHDFPDDVSGHSEQEQDQTQTSNQSKDQTQPEGFLPLQLTKFFGRETELEEITQLLTQSKVRLLTLRGTGGCGKTRLSIEVGYQVRDTFKAGVWFVSLADLREASLIPFAIRETLQLSHHTTTDPIENLSDVLRTIVENDKALLILDNFEHLSEEGTEIVTKLLRAVPNLTCLITSRHSLHLEGEHEYPVEPLPMAGSTTDLTNLAELMTYPSIQLFVDRAQSVKAHFQITERTAKDIVKLCEKLEGIPLAIELAATWVQVLAPAQMLERFTRRFDFLSSRRKDVVPRHRTLKATIDYSYDQLPTLLQRVLARLSVFQGGWSAEAAEAVCEPEMKAEGIILDALFHLKDRSLILAEGNEKAVRFRMLETIREYAAGSLPQGMLSDAANRHANYYREFAHRATQNTIDTEFENLRGAIEYYMNTQNLEAGFELVISLRETWLSKGLLQEGLAYIEALLQMQDAKDSANFCKALNLKGRILFDLGNFESAKICYEKAYDLSQKSKDHVEQVEALYGLAIIHFRLSDYTQADEYGHKCLEIAIANSYPRGIVEGYLILGNVALFRTEFKESLNYYQKGLSYEGSEQEYLRRTLLNNIALNYSRSNKNRAARAIWEQLHEQTKDNGDILLEARTLLNIGGCHNTANELHEAVSCYRQVLHLARRSGDSYCLFLCLNALARTASKAGYAYESAMLQSASNENFKIRLPEIIDFNDTYYSELKDALGEELNEAAETAGRALTIVEMFGLANKIQDLIQRKSA